MIGLRALLALPWLLCCAPLPARVPPAQVKVEALPSPRLVPISEASEALPVYLLLDATTSMETPLLGDARRADAAHRAAQRFAEALPAGTPLELWVLGVASGSACGPVLARELPGRSAILAQLADGFEARSEGSLPQALEEIARGIGRRGAGARVVAISDFEPACGGDLCQAAASLVAAGARVDLVAIGRHPAPACLDAVAVPDAPPPSWRPSSDPPSIPFRVTGAEGADAPELARGRAGGPPVEVAPGRVAVALELEPPLRLGSVELAPGELLWIRILDVGDPAAPKRELVVERLAVPGSGS